MRQLGGRLQRGGTARHGMACHGMAERSAGCMAEEAARLCDGNGKEKVLLLRLKQLLK